MLSPRDVRELQGISERWMDCTATIERLPTPGTKRPGGGMGATYAQVAAGRRCRVRPYNRAPTEPVIGDAVVESNLWLVVFPVNEDVTARDRYTIAGRTKGVEWMRVLEAVGVSESMTSQVQTAVICKQPGGRA